MLLPSGNPFKYHEEVFYLQSMIRPKRFDIFLPDWEMLRRSRHGQIFLTRTTYSHTHIITTSFSTRTDSDITTVVVVSYFEYCFPKQIAAPRWTPAGGVQRRLSTNHVAAILEWRSSSVGVNLQLWVCASSEAHRLPHVSRWVAKASSALLYLISHEGRRP